jgi:hypothetical protein
MCGTNCVETFASIEVLPPDALALLDQAPGLFAGRAWWDTVLAHAMPDNATASFVAIRARSFEADFNLKRESPSQTCSRSGGHIVALLPMLLTAGSLNSLTTPYTCTYTPLFATGLDQPTRTAAMATFAAFCRPRGIVRIDALPAEWPGLDDLETGARQAGLRTLHFDHFGNWYENVANQNWSTYLLGRPGALRETIRRRLRRAEKLPSARFDLFTQPAQMHQAVEAFESVYRRSWKDAEPFPTFNAALMQAMAAQRLLRLGVWSIGPDPVAVQFWVVKDGHAIVLKLAHDEAFKAHSPGTVLTALMLRHLLDQEHVTAIDFGRGDDAYKQGWATNRRQRIGLMLVNPWRIAGAATLLRHGAGRIRAALRKSRPYQSNG